MSENSKTGSHKAWADRIRALRNVPAVLRIMWESGRSVVTWGLILRVIVPLLGLLIGIVAARIITGVARALEHQPQFPHFWWLVASEVA
ncbi:MAG: ABC transporter ATP-binding protein, partial [Silvibacterium sp.]